MSPRIAALLGYDPVRVAELPRGQRRALALVALAALPGLTLLAASAAYGTWLASGAWAVALAVGAGAGLYLLNLLRVAVAGGGVSPQQPLAKVRSWMPRTVPLVMLGFLGAFFAQPLVLALEAAEREPAIEELRRELSHRHRATLLGTSAAGAEANGPTPREVEALRAYVAQLAASRFLVQRIHLAWARPARTIPLSAAMLLLMVAPWLASATVARQASRAYEAARWRANRAVIDTAYAHARRLEREALSRWPTFAGDRLPAHEDPPYDTRPRGGLAPMELRHG